MKLKIFVSLLVFLFALPLIAAPPQQGKISNSNNSLTVDNTTLFDGNRILMFVTNHGNFGRDLGGTFGYDYGTWYPYTGNIEDYSGHTIFGDYTPNYASGLWIGGTDSITGDTLVTVSEYSSEYVPGPMSGGTFMADNVNFRNFKLYSDSLYDNPNQDYLDYMSEAVPNQGAPVWTLADGNEFVIDASLDTIVVRIDYVANDTVFLGKLGEAQVLGDQFLWSVYNDADPAQHANIGTEPLGIEVKQAVYGWASDDAKGDIAFIRYSIYNKGSRIIENCNFSIWCDPDLGNSGDDFVACDTTLGLGYVWNDNKVDQNYAPNPIPSMGFDFLQGPLVAKTDPSQPDGIMWGQVYTDSTNLGMESFNKYINGTDPDDEVQAYNYMSGLTRDGAAYIYNGAELKYVLSGDPVASTGDIDVASSDRRWMQSTGPLTFRPGDSTEIYVAMVCGQANDNITSISLMRFNDRIAQKLYDDQWVAIKAPAAPILNWYQDDNAVTIAWNDTSEVDPGSYPFEGYTVFQGATKTGPWTRITTFDLNNTIKDVVDEQFNPTTAFPEIIRIVEGTNSGVKRFITITNDVVNGGSLNNLTEYHYKVEAYCILSNADLGLKKQQRSSNISLTPQTPVQDIVYEDEVADVLTVSHPSGVSDGIITPLVTNPDSLTGHTYQITFVDTIGIVIDTVIADPINDPFDTTFVSTDIAWHLDDMTSNTRILSWQTNQSGDDDYPIFHGMQVKISGPAAGFKSFSVVANGAGVVDPPDPGAFAFRGFPTPGDGNPSDAQQVGDGAWGIATGDNGGTNGGGSRGPYSTFLDRTLRGDAVRIAAVGINDFEVRFTGDIATPGTAGSLCWEWATDQSSYWIPLEIWYTGVSTPDDPSDDVRLLPYIFGDGSQVYELSSYGSDALGNCGPGGCEHSASGGDDDPYTGDWLYWRMPADNSAGQAGYLAFEAEMIADPTARTDDATPIMDRMVFVNWNGGVQPPFTQDMPEQGTVFRLETGKPNASSDVFTFSSTAPGALAAKNEDMLDAITTVPNPMYLFNSYSTSPGTYTVKFHHLPTLCTITIYNLAGELVRTIEKDDVSTAIADWDLLTENGLPVASGIYVYVVDAPGYGQKVGKMAIFVEEEVLKIY